jgi:mono/diheme cytochrome c family protein
VKENWDEQVARGAGRYAISCAPCHGGQLDGKGTVAGAALDGGPRLLVPPPMVRTKTPKTPRAPFTCSTPRRIPAV